MFFSRLLKIIKNKDLDIYTEWLIKSKIISSHDSIHISKKICECKLTGSNCVKIDKIRALIDCHEFDGIYNLAEPDFTYLDDFIEWYAFSTVNKIAGIFEYRGYFEYIYDDEIEFKGFITNNMFEAITDCPVFLFNSNQINNV